MIIINEQKDLNSINQYYTTQNQMIQKFRIPKYFITLASQNKNYNKKI